MPIPIRSGRFIPTAVGNAALMTAYANSPSGSSPRLWGTRPQQHRRGDVGRFIPTAVGNAHEWFPVLWMRSVHPHGCGERQEMIRAIHASGGSSPRLWGTPAGGGQPDRASRFIPTAVGNACTQNKRHKSQPVHPHGCGERPHNRIIVNGYAGSSPRLWGTRKRRRYSLVQVRFIPTAVGNAHSLLAQLACTAVHPHGCGERALEQAVLEGYDGSSPRLWGTHQL